MLAEIMKKVGFRTVAVLPTRYFQTWKGLAQGFTVVDTKAVRAWRRPLWHNGGMVAKEALKQMREHGDKPMFLWVHLYDTHAPHVQPPGTPKFGKSESDRYDAEVLYVDRQIKKIVTGAQRLLGPDTLIIITADHGESFDRLHRIKHHAADIHTTVVHVPLFVCAPGLVPGKRNQLASLMDITPTLVNLFVQKSASKHFRFRGMSLVPVLFNPDTKTQSRIFQTMFIPEKITEHKPALWYVGVTTPQYHMIRDLRHNTIQVFNWPRDIHDEHDLYSRNKQSFSPLKDALAELIYRIMADHIKH